MNNIKIDFDGRVTAWATLLKTPGSPKLQSQAKSPEMELFSSLPSEAKQEFLSTTLGSSHVTISHNSPKPKPRAVRGYRGISRYGRSLVRCAAQYLEHRFGLKHLTFATCTLPPTALADYTRETWAEVVRRFQKWLGYHLTGSGLSPLLVSVTEIQEHRLATYGGRPPVHLHLLFQGRKAGGKWAFRPDQFQAGWEQACQSVWDGAQEFGASTRVESLRKSSVNYLGKYMSKGGSALSEVSPDLIPSSWYSLSTKLKVFIKKAQFLVTGELATSLYRWLRGSDQMLWEKDIVDYNPETGFVWHMGWVGAIVSREHYHRLIRDVKGLRARLNPGVLTGLV